MARDQGARRPRPRRDRDEDVQPDGRGRRPRARAPRASGGRSRRACARLGVERVPLYLAHDFDPDVPQEETLQAFDELVRRGTVGAVGASNFTAEQLAEALELSALEGLPRYEWVQNAFSLLEQGDRETVFPLCHEHGLGYTPFSPLAGGWLTGQVPARRAAAGRVAHDAAARGLASATGPTRSSTRSRSSSARRQERGVSMAALALAWLLHVPEITAVVVGPNTVEQLAPVRRGARRRASTPTSVPRSEALFA